MPASPPYTIQNYPSVGEALQQVMYSEAAGQTFREGDPIYQDANGNIAGCAAPGALLSSTGNKPIGIAVDTANNLPAPYVNPDGSGRGNIRVDLLVTDALSVCPVTHATASLAVTALAQQGKGYQLRINPAGQMGGFSVALDQTSNPMVQVVRLTGQYPPGEQYGLEEVNWIGAALLGQ